MSAGLKAQSVEFECKFEEVLGHFLNRKLYTCTANFQNVTGRNSKAILKSAAHLPSKTSLDVESFVFILYQNIHFLPRGIDEIFPNLVSLQIDHSGLKEIHQEDLKNFPKLEVAAFLDNSIEYLEKDLFKFNPQLKVIVFDENEISFIHPKVFDYLNELSRLGLRRNPCIDEGATSRSGVLELIEKIKKTCSSDGSVRLIDSLYDKNDQLSSNLSLQIGETKAWIEKSEKLEEELSTQKSNLAAQISANAQLNESLMEINSKLSAQISENRAWMKRTVRLADELWAQK